MAVHDVSMEKIIEMNRLARSLKPHLDSLDDKRQLEEVNLPSPAWKPPTGDDAVDTNSPKLGKLRDTLQHEQIIALLENEEKNIDKIGEEMTSSLENGKAVLANIQEPLKEN